MDRFAIKHDTVGINITSQPTTSIKELTKWKKLTHSSTQNRILFCLFVYTYIHTYIQYVYIFNTYILVFEEHHNINLNQIYPSHPDWVRQWWLHISENALIIINKPSFILKGVGKILWMNKACLFAFATHSLWPWQTYTMLWGHVLFTIKKVHYQGQFSSGLKPQWHIIIALVFKNPKQFQ